MELIIQILMAFIFIGCCLRLSFWKLWQSIIFSAVCAVFILWSYQYAVMQSKTQLTDYLNNGKMMQNMAVLITIESVICIFFCFASLRQAIRKSKNKYLSLLNWYPGILIFPVLFYVMTQLIFNLSGVDFSTISYTLAFIAFISLPILGQLLKWLLDETEFRLEVYFLVCLFICILGLVTTVSGEVVYAAVEQPLHLKAYLMAFGVFALAFGVGCLWNKYKWIIKTKKNKF